MPQFLHNQQFETTFILHVLPVANNDEYAIRSVPEFVLEGVPLTHEVVYGQAWTLDLPATWHFDNLEVFYFKVELSIASTYLDYDEQLQ